MKFIPMDAYAIIHVLQIVEQICLMFKYCLILSFSSLWSRLPSVKMAVSTYAWKQFIWASAACPLSDMYK